MYEDGFGECVESFEKIGDKEVTTSAQKKSQKLLVSAVKTSNNQRRKTQMPQDIGARLEMLLKAEHITCDQNGPGETTTKKHKSIIDTDFKGIHGFQ